MSNSQVSKHIIDTQGEKVTLHSKDKMNDIDLGRIIEYGYIHPLKITDKRGDEWTLIGPPINHPDALFFGLNGYKRETDKFFWPANPTIPTAVHYLMGDNRKKLPPSVIELRQFRISN